MADQKEAPVLLLHSSRSSSSTKKRGRFTKMSRLLTGQKKRDAYSVPLCISSTQLDPDSSLHCEESYNGVDDDDNCDGVEQQQQQQHCNAAHSSSLRRGKSLRAFSARRLSLTRVGSFSATGRRRSMETEAKVHQDCEEEEASCMSVASLPVNRNASQQPQPQPQHQRRLAWKIPKKILQSFRIHKKTSNQQTSTTKVAARKALNLDIPSGYDDASFQCLMDQLEENNQHHNDDAASSSHHSRRSIMDDLYMEDYEDPYGDSLMIRQASSLRLSSNHSKYFEDVEVDIHTPLPCVAMNCSTKSLLKRQRDLQKRQHNSCRDLPSSTRLPRPVLESRSSSCVSLSSTTLRQQLQQHQQSTKTTTNDNGASTTKQKQQQQPSVAGGVYTESPGVATAALEQPEQQQLFSQQQQQPSVAGGVCTESSRGTTAVLEQPEPQQVFSQRDIAVAPLIPRTAGGALKRMERRMSMESVARLRASQAAKNIANTSVMLPKQASCATIIMGTSSSGSTTAVNSNNAAPRSPDRRALMAKTASSPVAASPQKSIALLVEEYECIVNPYANDPDRYYSKSSRAALEPFPSKENATKAVTKEIWQEPETTPASTTLQQEPETVPEPNSNTLQPEHTILMTDALVSTDPEQPVHQPDIPNFATTITVVALDFAMARIEL